MALVQGLVTRIYADRRDAKVEITDQDTNVSTEYSLSLKSDMLEILRRAQELNRPVECDIVNGKIESVAMGSI